MGEPSWAVEENPKKFVKGVEFTQPVTQAPQADAQARGGVLVCYTKNIPDAASADYDITVEDAIEVIDMVVQKRAAGAGANANTVQAKNAANAITDAVSINGAADTDVKRAGQVDDANAVIAAGGTLRISVVKAGGDAAVFVTVIGIRR